MHSDRDDSEGSSEKPLPVATSFETEKYWFSLGIFASRYAEVEFQINRLVRHYYGIDQNTANLLFFGALRVDAALGHLQRLMAANRIPASEHIEIDTLRQQLGLITRLRNDILHFGASSTEDGIVVTNAPYAHIEQRARTHIVSSELLDSSALDLVKIYLRLGIIMSPDLGQNEYYRRFGKLLNEPWRYIPPPQSRHTATHQDHPPRRRNRRRSSPR